VKLLVLLGHSIVVMGQRHRSSAVSTSDCREGSLRDPHLVDVGRNLAGINQYFHSAPPRSVTLSVCGVLLLTYLVCVSFLGVIGLITVLHTHSLGGQLIHRRLGGPVTVTRGLSTRIQVRVLLDALQLRTCTMQ
jgi:hypothetical protein